MSEEDELPPEVARSLSHRSRSTSPEGERPPLPPRPATLSFFRGTSANPAQRPTSRGTLLSTATTAVSLTGVNTNARHDGTRELRTSGINRTASAASVRSRRSVAHFGSGKTSDAGDTSSVLSYMPNDMAQDVESLFDDRIGLYEEVVENKDLYKIFDTDHHFEDVKINFVEEFSGVGQVERDRSNEGRDPKLYVTVETDSSKRNSFSGGKRRRSISSSSRQLESLSTLDMGTRISPLAT